MELISLPHPELNLCPVLLRFAWQRWHRFDHAKSLQPAYYSYLPWTQPLRALTWSFAWYDTRGCHGCQRIWHPYLGPSQCVWLQHHRPALPSKKHETPNSFANKYPADPCIIWVKVFKSKHEYAGRAPPKSNALYLAKALNYGCKPTSSATGVIYVLEPPQSALSLRSNILSTFRSS